jgi:hypothetical protein
VEEFVEECHREIEFWEEVADRNEHRGLEFGRRAEEIEIGYRERWKIEIWKGGNVFRLPRCESKDAGDGMTLKHETSIAISALTIGDHPSSIPHDSNFLRGVPVSKKKPTTRADRIALIQSALLGSVTS